MMTLGHQVEYSIPVTIFALLVVAVALLLRKKKKALIGSLVVAVGHPLGMRGALSAGIVHAVAPIVRGGAPWIHADVRLAPGNSGGPLADVSGAIVGVNAMIVGGLALAVPIARVIDFARSAGVAVP